MNQQNGVRSLDKRQNQHLCKTRLISTWLLQTSVKEQSRWASLKHNLPVYLHIWFSSDMYFDKVGHFSSSFFLLFQSREF